MADAPDVERILSNQEFKQWRYHTPFLYDFVFHDSLEWPSVTVEWIPDGEENEDYFIQNLIIGTQTADDDQNYIKIVQFKLPLNVDFEDDNERRPTPQVRTIQTINLDAEVNRARHMPTKPSMIATKAGIAEVYVFDCRQQPKFPLTGVCSPDLRLKGHNSEGFALSWSQLKPGHLLSGDEDGKICLWDINMVPENRVLYAMKTCKASKDVVEDVAWNKRHENLFGSVGGDGRLRIWDLRTTVNKPSQTLVAHEREVNCLAFNPFNEWMVLTGSEDKTVKLFDLRSPLNAVQTFQSHIDGVLQLGWNPAEASVFASCSHDNRVMLWDINRIGEEQTDEDAGEGPPELVFIHGGHTHKVSDISWSSSEEWLVASVADDNTFQIWRVEDHVYADEDDLPKEMHKLAIP